MSMVFACGTGSGAPFTPESSMRAKKQTRSTKKDIESSKISWIYTTRSVEHTLVTLHEFSKITQDRLSWSIWLYKDIGFQGMVHVALDTPYMKLFETFLAKKHRLAIDAWGADTSQVQHVYQPLIDHISQEVPEEFQKLYPFPVWKLEDRIGRLSRNILVSEFLVQEWAEHFRGKSETEIDEIAQSFKFEKCLHREGLNKILQANASLVAGN